MQIPIGLKPQRTKKASTSILPIPFPPAIFDVSSTVIVPDHRGLALEFCLGFLFVFLNVIIAKNCLWQDGASGRRAKKISVCTSLLIGQTTYHSYLGLSSRRWQCHRTIPSPLQVCPRPLTYELTPAENGDEQDEARFKR